MGQIILVLGASLGLARALLHSSKVSPKQGGPVTIQAKTEKYTHGIAPFTISHTQGQI